MKVDTALGVNNFYKNIKMCLNAVTRIWQDIFPEYHQIKWHYEFYEHFLIDHSHTSYYWNDHTYLSLGHFILVSFKNDTCLKYAMAPQA